MVRRRRRRLRFSSFNFKWDQLEGDAKDLRCLLGEQPGLGVHHIRRAPERTELPDLG